MSFRMHRRPRIDWYALRSGVELALRCCGFPPSTRIDGRVKLLAAGLNHDNFVFAPTADEPSPLLDHRLVLRRIRAAADEPAVPLAAAEDETPADRLRKEAATLRMLEELSCPFDAPRFVCSVEDDDGTPRAFVETVVGGFPLEPFKAGSPEGQTRAHLAIAAIGRAAAAVHRLPAARFPFLRQHADADAHLTEELMRLGDDCLRQTGRAGDGVSVGPPWPTSEQDPVAAAALDWIQEHRPKQRAAVVLHGDLLPQNLLRVDLQTERLGVIDWEYAQVGDPAYDLAIATRGHRKLLGAEQGLRRLIDAYREAGGAEVQAADVVVWELLLVLGWLRDALHIQQRGVHSGQPPEYYRDQLQGMLRRAPR